MNIKIYDKSFTALTTLVSSASGETDFNNLVYETNLEDIGQASFDMQLENGKATVANLRHYNRVEIIDDDGSTVRWIGVIVRKDIVLNVVKVNCYSLAYLLDRRLTDDGQVFNGSASAAASSLLSSVNTDEDTGIVAGTIDSSTGIDFTFNRSTVHQALRQIAKAATAQYLVDEERKLHMTTNVGTDKSSSVQFIFDEEKSKLNTILSFNVTDNGADIVTKKHGKSDPYTSTQENTSLKNTYGLLVEFENFREVGSQTVLDNLTLAATEDAEFAPSITLNPEKISDNFNVGDTVKVRLKNKLVDIDQTYQITSKTVQLRGNQKLITVEVLCCNTNNFVKQVSQLRQQVELLAREV